MARHPHKPLVKPDRQPQAVPPIGAWVRAHGSGIRGQVIEHHRGNRGLLLGVRTSDGSRAWFHPAEVVDAGERE